MVSTGIAPIREEINHAAHVDNTTFTFSLIGELGENVVVKRNDEITLDDIEKMAPQRIVVSPGPCSPTEAGISVPAIGRFAGKVPILGVCLGHQSIGQAFGGRIVHAKTLMHGKTSQMTHTGVGVFAGLPSPYRITRYPRWSSSAKPASLPRNTHGPMMEKSWGEAQTFAGRRRAIPP
jgi:anthranilate synthase component 2